MATSRDDIPRKKYGGLSRNQWMAENKHKVIMEEPPVSSSPRDFTTKDSGKRAEFSGGMVRDTSIGKFRPDLVKDGPMFLRWVKLMTRGAEKYAARNWTLASDQEAHDRYLESADRHFTIWYWWRRYGINIEDPSNPTREPLAEDHGAAVFFNIDGTELVAEKLESNRNSDDD